MFRDKRVLMDLLVSRVYREPLVNLLVKVCRVHKELRVLKVMMEL